MTEERKPGRIRNGVERLVREMGLEDLADFLGVGNADKGDGEESAETVSRAEYDALYAAYTRVEQEVEGFKVRLKREYTAEIVRAENNVLGSAFIALDALEGALRSLDLVEVDSEVKERIAGGLAMQRDTTLADLARKYEVRPVLSMGTVADPKYHHVVSEIPSKKPKGTIAYVIEAGYTRNDLLIREAKVVVSKGE